MENCDNDCENCTIGELINWLKDDSEAKELMNNPDVVKTLEYAIKDFGGILLVLPLPGISSAISAICNFAFLYGYKRALDSARLESIVKEPK